MFCVPRRLQAAARSGMRPHGVGGNFFVLIVCRILAHITSIIANSWQPRYEWHDPVLWEKREHNQIADHLANLTMDTAMTWSEESHEYPSHGNLLIHSDGGSRERCSAAAWVVEHCFYAGTGWQRQVLACGGLYLEARVSSFMSECLALEASAICVTKLLGIGC